jgi:hypothetical protein
MRIVKIKTTAYEEEDFLLLTDIKDDDDIQKVIEPIVERERNGGEYYDNDELISALEEAYPNAVVEMYDVEGLDVIRI